MGIMFAGQIMIVVININFLVPLYNNTGCNLHVLSLIILIGILLVWLPFSSSDFKMRKLKLTEGLIGSKFNRVCSLSVSFSPCIWKFIVVMGESLT